MSSKEKVDDEPDQVIRLVWRRWLARAGFCTVGLLNRAAKAEGPAQIFAFCAGLGADADTGATASDEGAHMIDGSGGRLSLGSPPSSRAGGGGSLSRRLEFAGLHLEIYFRRSSGRRSGDLRRRKPSWPVKDEPSGFIMMIVLGAFNCRLVVVFRYADDSLARHDEPASWDSRSGQLWADKWRL